MLSRCTTHHFGLEAQLKPIDPHDSPCTRPWSTAEGFNGRTCNHQRKGNKSTNTKCLSLPTLERPASRSSGKIFKEHYYCRWQGCFVTWGQLEVSEFVKVWMSKHYFFINGIKACAWFNGHSFKDSSMSFIWSLPKYTCNLVWLFRDIFHLTPVVQEQKQVILAQSASPNNWKQ